MDYAEVFKSIISYLPCKWRNFRDNQFLKKHGCKTWKEYHYRNDPGVTYTATQVDHYYSGYPYIFRFERGHKIYDADIWYTGQGVVSDWINENCQGGFRFDALRVTKQQGIGIDGKSETVWFIDELGGGDYVYVAFKSQRDYAWFLLKWGT